MIRQRTSHTKVVPRSCLFYDRLALQCASTVFCYRWDSPTLNTKIENARIFGDLISNPAFVLVLVSLFSPHYTRPFGFNSKAIKRTLTQLIREFLSSQKFTL